MIVEEQQWQPMIDEIWNTRQAEDYNGNSVFRKDFLKSWDHPRAIKKRMSVEDLKEWTAEDLDVQGLSVDPTNQTIERISIDQFKDSLNERDRNILTYRMQGANIGGNCAVGRVSECGRRVEASEADHRGFQADLKIIFREFDIDGKIHAFSCPHIIEGHI